MSLRTVLVTGANGYIGSAVTRAFARDGWLVYGLVRRKESINGVAEQEVIPILGTPANVEDWYSHIGKCPDVIVSTTEDLQDYVGHFNTVLTMVKYLTSQTDGRPLLLFTSGCKDYGMTGLADAPNLNPSTETSSLDPPLLLTNRARCTESLLEVKQAFDVVVVRPTTVYGLTSSYYSEAFVLAEAAMANGKPLIIPADPRSIMHGCHVDDAADAYVALAVVERSSIVGNSFLISGHTYETAENIANALVAEYSLPGIRYEPKELTPANAMQNALFAFSQWVSSDKLRDRTGWKDVRPLFSQNVHAYRLAFEAYRGRGHECVSRATGMLVHMRQ